MTSRKFVLALGLLVCTSMTLHAQPVPEGEGETKPTTTDPATQKAIDAIKNETELQKVATAQLEQEAKLAKAKEDLTKAKLGTVTGQTTYTGAVTGETGKAESLLLVTKSAIDAAVPIRRSISPALETYSASDVVILTDPAQLGVSDAILFEVRRQALKQLGAAAQVQFDHAIQGIPEPTAAAAEETRGDAERTINFTTAGLVIDSLAKLGSYFSSNYKFGDVTVDPTADLLAAAVVQSFAYCPKRPRFYIPTRSTAADATRLTTLLEDLHAVNIQAVTNNAVATSLAAQLRSKSKDDPAILAAAARLDGAATAAASVTSSYQTLMTELTAAPESGREPLAVRIVKQGQLQDKLANKALILLLTGKQAAAYYVKSNLWTFLGGPPLYTMAGTSTSYTLMDSNGLVLAGGAVSHHAGYRSVGQVQRLFGGSTPAAGAGQCS